MSRLRAPEFLPPPARDSMLLRVDDGTVLPLDPARWLRAPSAAELRLLDQLAGPVLDVGCGPGRMVEGLARRGVAALGVDPAPGAVALTRRRGCAAVQRSVFERLPAEGRWASLLLLDGNLGIGGDPVRLLRRCRELIRDAGIVIADVEPPGTGWSRHRVRLERGQERTGWFDWSVVGADAVRGLAAPAGLTLRALECSGDGRWYARLRPTGPRRARAQDRRP